MTCTVKPHAGLGHPKALNYLQLLRRDAGAVRKKTKVHYYYYFKLTVFKSHFLSFCFSSYEHKMSVQIM